MRIQEVFLQDNSTFALRQAAESVESPYFILYMGVGSVLFNGYAIRHFLDRAIKSHADMVYSDRYDVVPGTGGQEEHRVLGVHEGTLRDDFDFGPVLLFRTWSFREALKSLENDYFYAGFYALRLLIGKICHIPMFLYSYDRTGAKPSPQWKSLPIPSPRPCDSLKNRGERQFAYVDPRNRKRQVEMEEVCTEHLRRIGAWLPPVFREIGDGDGAEWPVRASVVIPVFNRVRTVCDAVRSAMGQVCDFPFNVIVVDNHSTDGTSDALAALKGEYGAEVRGRGTGVSGGGEGERVFVPKLEVIVPKEKGHGIGGCWNEAVFSDVCGEFCVQLDSDDLYSGPDTLRRIVDGLGEQRCAMLVGSYALTDFDLNMIPPGVIDHREWTEENGRNNALRVNGLGAPRAFRTAVLREIGGFPDVSYGEDYAVGLRISREWRIGRIYDVLYLCRRWEGNSDSKLSVARQNENNAYKDGLRREEVKARIKLNRTREKGVAKVVEKKDVGPVRFVRWWERSGDGDGSVAGDVTVPEA